MSFEEFKREALKLSKDERKELMQFLSILEEDEDEFPDIERANLEEAKRRYREIKEGRIELLDGEAVFAELRAEPD